VSRSTVRVRLAAIVTSVVALVVGTAPLASSDPAHDTKGLTVAGRPNVEPQYPGAKPGTGPPAKNECPMFQATFKVL